MTNLSLKKIICTAGLSLSFLLLQTNVYAQTWVQVGNDIDGRRANYTSGKSVALSGDGQTLAIGAIGDDNTNADPNDVGNGEVTIYTWDGSNWIQKGNMIVGETLYDWAGWSVDLNEEGNIVTIGARNNTNTNGSQAGHVRVYEWNTTSWTQMGTDIDGEAANDRFGSAVAINANGKTFIAGAEYNDNTGPNAGNARVFQWDNNSWVQKGTSLNAEAKIDQAGKSVAISDDGNTVAFGAYLNDGKAYAAGHVRVFQWDSNKWLQKGIDIDGEATRDNSGISISMSADGNTIAIGAPGNIGMIGGVPGSARVYQWDNNNWVQKGADIDGEFYFSESGAVLTLSDDGNTLAISDSYYPTTQNNIGRVKLYQWDGIKWSNRGQPIIGEFNQDNSGISLSLNNNGSIIAIGATDNDGNGPESGHVRVFKLDPNTTNIPISSTYNHVTISPNPSSGLFIITDNSDEINSISVTNMLGQVTQTSQSRSNNKIALQITGQKGIYLLHIETIAGLHLIKKLIKQ